MVQSGVYGPASRRELGSQVREIVLTCFQEALFSLCTASLSQKKIGFYPKSCHLCILWFWAKYQPHFCLSFSNSKWKWTSWFLRNALMFMGKWKKNPTTLNPPPNLKENKPKKTKGRFNRLISMRNQQLFFSFVTAEIYKNTHKFLQLVMGTHRKCRFPYLMILVKVVPAWGLFT